MCLHLLHCWGSCFYLISILERLLVLFSCLLCLNSDSLVELWSATLPLLASFALCLCHTVFSVLRLLGLDVAWGCWFCSLPQHKNRFLIPGFRPFLAVHLVRLLFQTTAGMLSVSDGFWQVHKIKKWMPLTPPWEHLPLHFSFIPSSFVSAVLVKIFKRSSCAVLEKSQCVLVAGPIRKSGLNTCYWIAYENLAVCCFLYWQACLSHLRMLQRLRHMLSFIPPSLIWLNKKDCTW